MSRPLRPVAALVALAALVAVAALPGCSGTPRQIDLESPTPPPPPPSPWRFYSDAERIVDIAPTPDAVWAISQNGVLRWTRPGGQVHFAVSPGAPGDGATAIAVATDGTVYVGLRDGIAFKRAQPTAQWQRVTAEPLSTGVTALAPRKAGGVWVGMQRGLGFMHNGRLRLHSRLHTVRAMAVDDAGRLWAATASKGLVTFEGDRIVEHTTVNGLCANDVRSVAVGGPQVAVVCNTPKPTLALRIRNTWYPFALERGGAAIVDMQWHTGNWVIRSAGGWWRAVEVPAGATPGAAPAILQPMDPGRLPPPPALVQHARFTASTAVAKAAPAGDAADAEGLLAVTAADAGPAAKPAAEPTAPAAAAPADTTQAPPPPPPGPVEELLLECTRAQDRLGTAATAPRLQLLVEKPQLPEEGEVTVWRIGPDGFAWYGLAWRGLLAQKGMATQRYTSQSLVPRQAITRMAVDREGRALIPAAGPYLNRWSGSGWERRPVAPPDSAAEALAVAPDPAGGAWLLIGYPPAAATAPVAPAAPAEVDPVDAIAGAPVNDGVPLAPAPEIAVVRIDKARIERKGRLPVLGIDRPLRVGALDVSPLGELHFALFYESERGTLRGAGLGRVPVSHDLLVRWLARRAMGEESVDGTPLLPDGWISAIARPATRTGASPVFLGTNAGLVRVADGQMRVFDENDFIESEVITTLVADDRGGLWAGTLEGLGRLEGDRWTPIAAEGLSGRITRLAFGPDGRLWAGSDRGLYHNTDPLNADGWRAEPVRAGQTARDVRDVAFGADGSLWVLTGEGVYRRAAP